MARDRAAGAVGIKFEAAYLRPLNFDDPDPASAARVYAKYVRGGVPSRAEYKVLEDYLFRAIAREAGRLRLPIQIHALETFGGFYSAYRIDLPLGPAEVALASLVLLVVGAGSMILAGASRLRAP